jgi:hypothetical protein
MKANREEEALKAKQNAGPKNMFAAAQKMKENSNERELDMSVRGLQQRMVQGSGLIDDSQDTQSNLNSNNKLRSTSRKILFA